MRASTHALRSIPGGDFHTSRELQLPAGPGVDQKVFARSYVIGDHWSASPRKIDDGVCESKMVFAKDSALGSWAHVCADPAAL